MANKTIVVSVSPKPADDIGLALLGNFSRFATFSELLRTDLSEYRSRTKYGTYIGTWAALIPNNYRGFVHTANGKASGSGMESGVHTFREIQLGETGKTYMCPQLGTNCGRGVIVNGAYLFLADLDQQNPFKSDVGGYTINPKGSVSIEDMSVDREAVERNFASGLVFKRTTDEFSFYPHPAAQGSTFNLSRMTVRARTTDATVALLKLVAIEVKDKTRTLSFRLDYTPGDSVLVMSP
ncbi:MAG: hypothetical protein V1909_02555 [Candidatus Micrarchaeota archaeon]